MKAIKAYYNQLTQLFDVFCDYSNSHQKRMDAMREYKHMLENKDAYLKLYLVEL